MDLTTPYCGLTLKSPLTPGASPMVNDLDTVRGLEDAGAGAIVMHSLFEEQIIDEDLNTRHLMEVHTESFPEALTYMPFPSDFRVGPHAYLERIGKIKSAVSVPVIASLNGTTPGGWTHYARLIEQAGADALELNCYRVPVDTACTGEVLEAMILELVEEVRAVCRLPLAVKLSPYHSALPNFAQRLLHAGATGLVLFNRHFQPDIDIEELELRPVYDSSPSELALRLRWIGILDAAVPDLSYAATGGVHDLPGVIKTLMCGADTVQLVTHLLHHGPGALGQLLHGLQDWLETHDYQSLDQLRGSMNIGRSPNPAAYTRAHYIKQLQGYTADA